MTVIYLYINQIQRMNRKTLQIKKQTYKERGMEGERERGREGGGEGERERERERHKTYT